MMSHAPQRDCAGKASRPATNDDKADLKSCLLRGFMTTLLNKRTFGILSAGTRDDERKKDIRGEEVKLYA
jgi:hypothetical protein